ncbi:Gp49 family protein [Aneurinibacillus sp. Ricciae_BoGa-3]|uniref:Gp49 family protein n=1 Tax=Aneurinibacillus sp. Ricciae_BoGa-3 TaxID=3022697 RepID=UPI0023414283|nr:Gp49 family protein [Aneurinibacillus sp. Ricciae_BoGa-3]WCK56667.1 Gp49 family protein [Aneurinibacillus sp. Ricciae_BoGa-3]
MTEHVEFDSICPKCDGINHVRARVGERMVEVHCKHCTHGHNYLHVVHQHVIVKEYTPEEKLRNKIKSLIENKEFAFIGKRTTICLLTLKGGYEAVGKSAVADEAAFDEEIGKKYAFEDAMKKAIIALGAFLNKEDLK